MRLRTVKTSLLWLAKYQGIEGDSLASLAPFGEVLTWQLITWLARNKVEFLDFTDLEAVPIGFGLDKVVNLKRHERNMTIGFPYKDVGNILELSNGERFELLFRAVKDSALELNRLYGSDPGIFLDAITQFNDSDYTVRISHTKKLLHSKSLELSIESEMGIGGAMVFFVARLNEAEVWREHIETTSAFAGALWRRFKKIRIDDGQICVDEKLHKDVRQIDIQGQLFHRKPTRDPYYKWSLSLASLEAVI